jgi:hypothetical protein
MIFKYIVKYYKKNLLMNIFMSKISYRYHKPIIQKLNNIMLHGSKNYSHFIPIKHLHL